MQSFWDGFEKRAESARGFLTRKANHLFEKAQIKGVVQGSVDSKGIDRLLKQEAKIQKKLRK